MLLSDKLREQEKLEIIEREYNIPINSEVREEVTTMCNLSDGIEERAVKRGAEKATEETTQKMILSMYENDLSLELISSISKMSVEEIERIINENEPVLA